MKHLPQGQPIQMYDMFVSTLLREIMRPINFPLNFATGTSQESNMASAIVDSHIYRGGQIAERNYGVIQVNDPAFCLWYQEARLIDGYLPKHKNRAYFPSRSWRWDKVGLDHTDPQKVMEALKIAHDKGFITDKQVQETHFNLDVEDWRSELEKDKKWRDKIGLPIVPPVDTVLPPPPSSPEKKPKSAKAEMSAEMAQQIANDIMEGRYGLALQNGEA
jgi:hypothetical protein